MVVDLGDVVVFGEVFKYLYEGVGNLFGVLFVGGGYGVIGFIFEIVLKFFDEGG